MPHGEKLSSDKTNSGYSGFIRTFFVSAVQQDPKDAWIKNFFDDLDNIEWLDTCFQNKQHLALLTHSNFSTFVNRVLKEKYDLLPQNNLHSFDLLSGLVYYQQTQESLKNTDEEKATYWQKAQKKHCYWSLAIQANEDRDLLFSATSPLPADKIAHIIAQAETLATRHETPSHLSAALTYFALMQYYAVINNRDLAYAAYQQTSIHLQHAKEKINTSQNAIKNYSDATGIRYFLPQGTTTIDEAIQLKDKIALTFFNCPTSDTQSCRQNYLTT
jgi:hypothetical protein